MSSAREGERPCREWWAVLGTVTDALEGFGSCCLGIEGAGGAIVEIGPGVLDDGLPCCLKYDGGKCFALYVSCTWSSSCSC
jgi:hypothetical protein